MKEVILKIEGMVCVNCENLIEDILLDNNGVNKVEVSYTKGLAKINYNENKTSINDLIRVISENGYKVIDFSNEVNEDLSNKNKKSKKRDIDCANKDEDNTFLIIIIILGVILLLKKFGVSNIFSVFPTPNENTSYSMLFIIGLFTLLETTSLLLHKNTESPIKIPSESILSVCFHPFGLYLHHILRLRWQISWTFTLL